MLTSTFDIVNTRISHYLMHFTGDISIELHDTWSQWSLKSEKLSYFYPFLYEKPLHRGNCYRWIVM